jgi:hypothetical protein
MQTFKTIEECLVSLGYEPDYRPDASGFPEEDRSYSVSDWVLAKVIKAHNFANDPTWVADFKNQTQKKFWNYGYVVEDATNPTGFRFTYTLTHCDHAGTDVGARFLLLSDELARYIINQFPQLYLDCHMVILINKQS